MTWKIRKLATAHGQVDAATLAVGSERIGLLGPRWVVERDSVTGFKYWEQMEEVTKMNTDLNPLEHALSKVQAVAKLTQASILLERETEHKTFGKAYQASVLAQDVVDTLNEVEKAIERLKAL
jgi:hypothetical protein